MKHFLLIGLILLVLGSCKKDSNDNQEPTTGKYYIKYKIDGRQIAHEGEWLPSNDSGVQSRREPLGIGIGNEKKLVVDGRTGANEVFHLMIVSDSVKTGENYVLNNLGVNGWVVISTNSKHYEILGWSNAPPYSMTIHIDKHAGGWITGTFSGKLGRPVTYDPPGGVEEVTITEGSFSSKVVYQ